VVAAIIALDALLQAVDDGYHGNVKRTFLQTNNIIARILERQKWNSPCLLPDAVAVSATGVGAVSSKRMELIGIGQWPRRKQTR